MSRTKEFKSITRELIRACRALYPIWDVMQGQEFAWERGWLKGHEEEEYLQNKATWDNNIQIYERLRKVLKEEFPEELKAYATGQYEKLSALIKITPKDSPDFDEEWRSIRRNWSALAKGKRPPYNELWNWARVIEG